MSGSIPCAKTTPIDAGAAGRQCSDRPPRCRSCASRSRDRLVRYHARSGWASCPITQNGCIRIMSHPGVSECVAGAGGDGAFDRGVHKLVASSSGLTISACSTQRRRRGENPRAAPAQRHLPPRAGHTTRRTVRHLRYFSSARRYQGCKNDPPPGSVTGAGRGIPRTLAPAPLSNRIGPRTASSARQQPREIWNSKARLGVRSLAPPARLQPSLDA